MLIHKCKYLILLSLVAMSCTSPKSKNPNTLLLDSLSVDINKAIAIAQSRYSSAELISLGFTQIGDKIIQDSLKINPSDENKIRFAKLYMGCGNILKALDLINAVQKPALRYETIYLRFIASLNEQDNAKSKAILDTLKYQFSYNYSASNEINYLSALGYYYHNRFKYDSALLMYKNALDSATKYNANGHQLIALYRRIANTYNNLFRSTDVKQSKAKLNYLIKANEYYTKEKAEILKLPGDNTARLVNNKITSDLLCESVNANKHFREDLKDITVANDSDYLITLNPVYASIAINWIIATNKCNKGAACIAEYDSIQDLTQKLINQETLTSLSSVNGLDIALYNKDQYNQRNKLNHRYASAHKEIPKRAEDLLRLSALTKYNNIDLITTVNAIYGTECKRAVNTWALLHELDILGRVKHLDNLSSLAKNGLNKLNISFKPILSYLKNKTIGEKQIGKLVAYCKKNDAAIYDYCLWEEGYQVIRINQFGIKAFHSNTPELDPENTFVKSLQAGIIDQFYSYIDRDSVNAFEQVSGKICKYLILDSCNEKNIIISTDLSLGNLPFSALCYSYKNCKKWSELSYLGDLKCISYIPNIFTLFKDIHTCKKPEINILYSTKDANSLPKNKELISALLKNYGAQINKNSKEDYQILHILGHTVTNGESVSFILEKDTISINTQNIHPKLAILQGCNTEKGKFIWLDGALSLNRSFFYNGTDAVIGSFWAADDISSCYYLKEFYNHLWAGESISKAMWKAHLSVRHNVNYVDWAKPYYWANWRMMGQDLMFAK